MNVIIALMQAFDASMKDTRDMEDFIFDVEEDKDIHVTAVKEMKRLRIKTALKMRLQRVKGY